MDEKTLNTLEFHKILDRLAGYAAFAPSEALARGLRPSNDMDQIRLRQARTTEARHLLSINADLTIGGARDIAAPVDLAAHSGVLEPHQLLDIKGTLVSARNLWRSIEKHGGQYPSLAEIAARLPPPAGLVNAISQAISDRGDVLDGASEKLGRIRSELKIAHQRLFTRLERMLSDPKMLPLLQEAIITQRNGRYVIPLRAEFKGRVRSIIHDQSASGATFFVEPLVVVELNNKWHELQLDERDEIRRILTVLSAQVGEHADQIQQILSAMAELDMALMCAKYAEDLHAAEPLLEPFGAGSASHPGSTIKLYQARHPLLDPASVVPIDLDLDEKTYVMIITGPNTGGKTVTLKTAGLLALMAQSGLHIPAQSGSTLSVFEDIYADIGDEQSIEQSLSTFSSHITNIVRILRWFNRKSLVLLDELGAGTDPQEGAALARAILSYLVEKRITCLVATHYPELKAFAHATPGAINASVEFDLQSLRPTYHLSIGLPGRSNALLIAERLGLLKEILQSARTTINPTDLRTEDLLDEIHRQRGQARKAREDADRSYREAEKMRGELERRLENLEDERLDVLEKSRQQAEAELENLHAELAQVRRELNRAHLPLEVLKPLQEQVESLQEDADRPIYRRQVSQVDRAPLRVGEKVMLRSLKMNAVVTSLGEKEIEVQAGALRVRAQPDDILRLGEPEEARLTPQAVPSARAGAVPQAVFHASPGMELDLRGQAADDALDVLDRYLESAYLARLPYVRIIHGKGTGKLRQVIRTALRQSPHVSGWTAGQDREGGEGVTVAHMVKE